MNNRSNLVSSIKDYNIWYIDSIELAKELGRSSKWCICTDNGEYYWNNDHKNDTFYFLIRKELKNDEFDKLAFEYKANGEIKVWDINNRKNTFKDEEILLYMKENFKWIDKVTDIERYFLNPISIKENDDGTINVYGSIYLDELNLKEFPWKNKYRIKELFGSLYIQGNNFESLEGCPEIIHGDFDYSNNPIKDNINVPKVDGIKYKK